MSESKKTESKKIKIEIDQITLWRAGTVIFAVLFIIAIFTGGFRGTDSGTGAVVQAPPAPIAGPTGAPPQIIKADIDIKNEPCMGDKGADVTIIEFTDYQCPFCSRAHTNTFPEIKKLVDQGKVRYCIKDYALPIHPNAEEASIAANCAGEQDKYWEMNDKLFVLQSGWSSSPDPNSIFKGYAKDLGLDEGKFASCIVDPKQLKEVQGDFSEVSGIGTPTFYINGKQLQGAQPWPAFKTIIDAELSA